MVRLLVLSFVMLFANSVAQAEEKFFGSNVDARVTLAYWAPEQAIQKLLPDTFVVQSPGAGPLKGANVYLVLIDPQIVLDAEGKPTDSDRVMVVAVAAKEKSSGQLGPVIVGGFVYPKYAPGAYGVYAASKLRVERKIVTLDEKSTAMETWDAQADQNSLHVALEYDRKLAAKSTVEQKVFAGGKPGFYRIYRFDQAADIVFSAPANIDRKPKIALKAEGKFAEVFNGVELVAMISIPWYARKIFVPAN
jgi:hypothetical protein